jgi:hypothetical protein
MKAYGDVTGPLLHERMMKRLVYRQSPDSRVLREAMRLAHEHLYYIDYLVDHRPVAGWPDDEPGRSGRRRADFGGGLSGRAGLAGA